MHKKREIVHSQIIAHYRVIKDLMRLPACEARDLIVLREKENLQERKKVAALLDRSFL